MYIPKERTYQHVFSGDKFRLYESDKTGKTKLINESTGEEPEAFYACALIGVTLRLKDKQEIYLKAGQFLPINTNNPITHKKYIGFKRFSKI